MMMMMNLPHSIVDDLPPRDVKPRLRLSKFLPSLYPVMDGFAPPSANARWIDGRPKKTSLPRGLVVVDCFHPID